MRPLFKTTIVIWSEHDPVGLELSELALDAERGDSYCSVLRTHIVRDPVEDKDWDGTEFFTEDECPQCGALDSAQNHNCEDPT